ncbi:hypothetical protein GOP47_0005118 [Adiantum capillus-veneris]|uniref:PI-PLC X domain-containing protein n=1 Tax=Adiantum capillus-veneris TaxID=13818 RepID=A0A9D4V4Y4_ADICA|nr:hypothetical protein GOP47_0005118 [Adiantum capillus-veneris]
MHLPSAILAAIVLLCCSHRSQALCSNGHCQLRQVCLRSADCSAGLFCSTCVANGDALRRCHRFMTTNATAIRGDLPFNRYSWITTHNSFAIVGEPSHTGVPRLTFVNQEDSVSTQLKNGVRGLMLDMYDFLGNVWLCHSYGGVCYNFTAFEPAINALKEVEAFLLANPTEIVTVFIEDYVRSTKGLTNVFTEAGLKKYWFPVSLMPKSGGDWPTIIEMVAKNYRLVVFTSNRTKEASEGIAYNWRYVNENQYGNGGMTAGECPKRAESAAMNSTSRSLVLVNFFRDNPVQAQACKYNSAPLKAMLPVCYAASGNRWPNYVAVDFYKRSDGGGALVAMDMVNAGLMCGCSDINVCKLNLPFGVCNVSSSTDPPTALLQPNATSQANFHKRSPYPLLYVVSILLYICTIT